MLQKKSETVHVHRYIYVCAMKYFAIRLCGKAHRRLEEVGRGDEKRQEGSSPVLCLALAGPVQTRPVCISAIALSVLSIYSAFVF